MAVTTNTQYRSVTSSPPFASPHTHCPPIAIVVSSYQYALTQPVSSVHTSSAHLSSLPFLHLHLLYEVVVVPSPSATAAVTSAAS